MKGRYRGKNKLSLIIRGGRRGRGDRGGDKGTSDREKVVKKSEVVDKGNFARVRCSFLISRWHCYTPRRDPLIGRRGRGRRHRIDCRLGHVTNLPRIYPRLVLSFRAPSRFFVLVALETTLCVSHWPIPGNTRSHSRPPRNAREQVPVSDARISRGDATIRDSEVG